MNRLSINLLPPEFAVEKKFKAKKTLVFKSSVAVLVVMIILSAAILGLGFYQNSYLDKSEATLASSEQKIASLKDREGLILALTSRVNNIRKLLQQESPEAAAYLYITGLTPPGINITVFNTESGGSIRLTGTANDSTDLGTFLDKLAGEKASGNITTIKLDSLSQSSDLDLNFDMLISVSPKLAKV